MLLLSATLFVLSLSTVGSGELGTCSLAISFEAWYKYNFDVFQPGNPFLIQDIPNPLCALMTNGQSTGCSECSSKLQQWYLSQKCMAACHEHNCAPYDGLLVECTFAPDNFLSGPPEELKWGAKCICPANTIHAGEEMTVADTSYKQMLDEWNRNRCYDANAVGRDGIVACDPFACSSSNISWCDNNAVCSTNHSNPHGFTCDNSAALTGGLCSEIPTIANGYLSHLNNSIIFFSIREGDMLKIKCNKDYTLIDPSMQENSIVECRDSVLDLRNRSCDDSINGAICSSASDCLSATDSRCSEQLVNHYFNNRYCFDKCSNDSQCHGNTKCHPTNLFCYCTPSEYPCSTDADCCSDNCNEDDRCEERSLDNPCVTDVDCEYADDEYYDYSIIGGFCNRVTGIGVCEYSY